MVAISGASAAKATFTAAPGPNLYFPPDGYGSRRIEEHGARDRHDDQDPRD